MPRIVDITGIIPILQETVRRLCHSVRLAGPCALNAHRQLESSSCTPGVCLSFPKAWKAGANGSAADSPSRVASAVCPQLSRVCSHHLDVSPPAQRHKWPTAEGHWKPQCWAAWNQHSFAGDVSDSLTHVSLAKWIMMSCFRSVL